MTDLNAMTAAQLRRYAVDNEIELGNQRNKADILKAIQAAEIPVEPPAVGETSTIPSVEESTEKQDKTGDSSNDKDLSVSSAFTLSRVLKVTAPPMKGEDVRMVQKALSAAGFGVGIEGTNGEYNDSTALAVRHVQSMHRLIVNGRVNKITVEKMGGVWKDPQST
jgi:hypothetical protein